MESSEKNNGSVIIYQSWFETAAKLGTEKQITAIMQILNYGFYGTVPDNSGDLYLELLFDSWKPLVDAANIRRKGGAPKGNQNAKGKGAPKGNKNAAKNKQQNKQPFNKNDNSMLIEYNSSPSSSSSEEESTQGNEGWTGEDDEWNHLDEEFDAWQARMKEQEDGTV